MHRSLPIPILLLLLLVPARLAAVTIGQPAPELGEVAWSPQSDLQPRRWQLAIWWHPETADDPGPLGVATDLARRHGAEVAIAMLHAGEALPPPEDRAVRGLAFGTAGRAARERWLAAGDPVPYAVLSDCDGIAWWAGSLVDAPRMLELARAEELDLTSMQALVSLEAALREAIERGGIADTRRAADTLLAFDPQHETARYVLLSLAREAGEPEAYRAALAAIDVEATPVRFLVELAGDLATDPDLRWRAPAQALRLAEAAAARAPDDLAALGVLARVRYVCGRITGALAAAERAGALAPEHAHLAAEIDFYRQVAELAAEDEP